MFREADEPSMFDDIQTMLFASTDNIGKAFRVLNENLRLCLICDELFTRQGATMHAATPCYPQKKSCSGNPTQRVSGKTV
jgi:hypothetical protein